MPSTTVIILDAHPSPTPELLDALRTPDGFGGRCGRCEFRTVCGGSRSHAFAVTGDPLASDPTCSYVPDARRFPERAGQPV